MLSTGIIVCRKDFQPVARSFPNTAAAGKKGLVMRGLDPVHQ